MRVAIIDLGTNTCNLLIAETNKVGFQILHQSKQLVKLGDDKIKTNEISPAATQRTIDAFQIHKRIIQKHTTEKVRVIATSAVRSAENKINYLEQLGDNSGWAVKVITGDKEAELIFKGVLLALQKLNSPSVILDIGGGSNELIVAQGKNLVWKESQATGMARIINQFPISDPIHSDELDTLKKHFSRKHKNAFEKCITSEVRTLIGCSGAFDTIADIIDQVNPGEKVRKTQTILISDFYNVYDLLIKSTREQRLKMKGMDMVRVDLIVPAVVLIEQLITEIGIKEIIQTDYALREGILYEMMSSN